MRRPFNTARVASVLCNWRKSTCSNEDSGHPKKIKQCLHVKKIFNKKEWEKIFANKATDRDYLQNKQTAYAAQYKKKPNRTSMVVQWLRIHLPMQGVWVRENSTWRGTTKPVHHNQETHTTATRDWPSLAETRENPSTETKTQGSLNK